MRHRQTSELLRGRRLRFWGAVTALVLVASFVFTVANAPGAAAGCDNADTGNARFANVQPIKQAYGYETARYERTCDGDGIYKGV